MKKLSQHLRIEIEKYPDRILSVLVITDGSEEPLPFDTISSKKLMKTIVKVQVLAKNLFNVENAPHVKSIEPDNELESI